MSNNNNKLYQKILLFLKLDDDDNEDLKKIDEEPFKTLLFPYTSLHFQKDVKERDKLIHSFYMKNLKGFSANSVCTNDFHKSLIVNYVLDNIKKDKVENLLLFSKFPTKPLDLSLLSLSNSFIIKNIFNTSKLFYHMTLKSLNRDTVNKLLFHNNEYLKQSLNDSNTISLRVHLDLINQIVEKDDDDQFESLKACYIINEKVNNQIALVEKKNNDDSRNLLLFQDYCSQDIEMINHHNHIIPKNIFCECLEKQS